MQHRITGPLFLFANAAAGLSVKDSQLDASQYIYNTVQASTSFLTTSDVRASFVSNIEVGLLLQMSPNVALRVSGTAGYDSATPYFRAQTDAAPGPYPNIIPAAPAQMAYGEMVTYGAGASLKLKF